jgi:hypothetical protein
MDNAENSEKQQNSQWSEMSMNSSDSRIYSNVHFFHEFVTWQIIFITWNQVRILSYVNKLTNSIKIKCRKISRNSFSTLE